MEGAHADDVAERAEHIIAEGGLALAVADSARAHSAVPAPLAVPARHVPLALDRELVPRKLVRVVTVAVDLPDLGE